MSSASRRAPYLALRHRDYRRLIVSQLLSLTGSQMQVVAINWHIYLLTRSPLALGFVGLTASCRSWPSHWSAASSPTDTTVAR